MTKTDYHPKPRKYECPQCRGDHRLRECPETKNIVSCANCMMFYLKAWGYSNWTVEGHEACCAAELNPNFPQESPYDLDEKPGHWEPAQFAKRCSLYTNGETLGEIDVDRENEQTIQEVAAINSAMKQYGPDAALAVRLNLFDHKPSPDSLKEI